MIMGVCGRTHTDLGAGFMESFVVFSHPSPPLDIRDYVNAAPPVQAPVFSDDPDGQLMACPTTS
jgi:hypothetical protein